MASVRPFNDASASICAFDRSSRAARSFRQIFYPRPGLLRFPRRRDMRVRVNLTAVSLPSPTLRAITPTRAVRSRFSSSVSVPVPFSSLGFLVHLVFVFSVFYVFFCTRVSSFASMRGSCRGRGLSVSHLLASFFLPPSYHDAIRNKIR